MRDQLFNTEISIFISRNIYEYNIHIIYEYKITFSNITST